jgi:hypothetical protein
MTVAEVGLRKDRETDAVEYFTVMVKSVADRQSAPLWSDYGEFTEARIRQMLFDLGCPQAEVAQMFARARAHYHAVHP